MANLPVPVPRTFTVSEVENAAFLNSIRDAITFLANPPRAVVYQTTAQSIGGAGVAVAATFDATQFDEYGGHSNVTNNSRYTAQVAGTYEVAGSYNIAANATGIRLGWWYKNGSPLSGPGYEALVNAATGGNPTTVVMPVAQVPLAVGDYLEMWVANNSGSSLALGTGQLSPVMSMKWVHA